MMLIHPRGNNSNNSRSILSRLATLCKQEKNLQQAISLVQALNHSKTRVPNPILTSLLLFASKSKSLKYAIEIHDAIPQNAPPFLSAHLIRTYDCCGSIKHARQVFDEIPRPDIYSWNAIIRAYSKRGLFQDALGLFRRLLRSNVLPDDFTFPCVLKACGDAKDLLEGKTSHVFVFKMGFRRMVFVDNALVSMYARCGCIEDARKVFDRIGRRDVVSWNSMISGLGENGLWQEALVVFSEMERSGEGVLPDCFTFASVFKACGELGDLERGVLIHELVGKLGFGSDVLVNNAVVGFYAKCCRMDLALQVFEKMPAKDVFSWTSMIAGYQERGDDNEALRFFKEMWVHSLKPNQVTFTSVLPACAQLSDIYMGRAIHSLLIICGYDVDEFASCALIDMYCKCGDLEDANRLFKEMPEKAIVSWNSMISGLGMNGHGKKVVSLFKEMEKSVTKPDHVTFVALLSACGHSGMINEGLHYFDCMINRYGIPAKTEHYACMVDLLGRAGSIVTLNWEN
ncbi:pentatricopeptide repeat-containing protein At1g11290, chloroplastic-like isoform X2 [Magnolia sinica]|uniref:pentatricopeptide repeat-containing protein At1g11290, chloroplastic-like isoform X2 n=1 Tax=Magnolia sinica TaxID=86752 RepID=UPI0026585A00|nr:pentatricopeptide repeat-containing protein At1g11290, chloroplastic-like isoform X2 [Magnolia sinica]